MARFQDVLSRIQGALAVDAARHEEITTEMGKYADAYYRYVSLRWQSEEHEKSAQGFMALLGPQAHGVVVRGKKDDIEHDIDGTLTPEDLRDTTFLWEHVRNYLRVVPECQVREVFEFFGGVGIEVSRQAVDSAINRHKKVFQKKKRGRKTFVSLKGA